MQPVMFTGYKPVPHHGLETGAPHQSEPPCPQGGLESGKSRAGGDRAEDGLALTVAREL